MARYAPATDAGTTIIDAFGVETSLRSNVRAASRRSGHTRDVILGNVLHLMFCGELDFDPSLPLTMESLIRRHQELAA